MSDALVLYLSTAMLLGGASYIALRVGRALDKLLYLV
ncbi:hypothetical protein LCGC14_0921990 [marine sediment metagenome]|uniref:Uncharacterized protein n=1 Tax=marine sediment metagenome TaxID=412755 RepID=A0A0F9RX89_9ZZZZ